MALFDIFAEVPCLTEQSQAFSGLELQKKWFKSADRRTLGQSLQKFIAYNANQFDFLKVQPSLQGTDQNIKLIFKTSEYVGAIPLRAPDTGKQIGDFIVLPRFSGSNKFEDYIDLINLFEKDVLPEYQESLPLASGRSFRPPRFLQAIKYIQLLEKLSHTHWHKFTQIQVQSADFKGQINWSKKIQEDYKVENKLKFPTKINTLNAFHQEYAQLKYVYELAKTELASTHTPLKIKVKLKDSLHYLDRALYAHKANFTHQIQVKTSDPALVKNCKIQANKLLNFESTESTAWRINFADVFEKLVQYTFAEVAKITGGKLVSNPKFYAQNASPYAWNLKYLEADAIYQKDDLLVFIDAKYKSNLYNKYSNSQDLKEAYRHDLHQILAYTAFSKTTHKFGFLCYPSPSFELKTTSYLNAINQASNNLYILGLPLKKDSIKQAQQHLIAELNALSTRHR